MEKRASDPLFLSSECSPVTASCQHAMGQAHGVREKPPTALELCRSRRRQQPGDPAPEYKFRFRFRFERVLATTISWRKVKPMNDAGRHQMSSFRLFGVVAMAASCLLLAACQSSAQRKQELQTLCADPSNRAPGSDYFQECQSLYPLTDRQRVNLYMQSAPQ